MVKRGVHRRIIRRTTKKGLLGKSVVEHAYDRGAWKKTKAKYGQVSNLLPTRAAARIEKRRCDGNL
jgi:hypothetical protein